MDISDIPTDGIKAKINGHGKTLAIGVPITTAVVAFLYFIMVAYTDHCKMLVMEPTINQHLITSSARTAEILVELKNIDRRLQRIELKLDSSDKVASISTMLTRDN